MGSAPELQKLLSHGRGTNVAARRGLPKHISNGPGDFCYVRSAARVHQGWAENLHIPKVFVIAMRKAYVLIRFLRSRCEHALFYTCFIRFWDPGAIFDNPQGPGGNLS